MDRQYSPLKNLLLTLNQMVKSSGMSLREVQRKTDAQGVTMNNVCAVANGHPENLAVLVKLDKYISEILRVTGHDEYDLLKMTAEGLTNPRSKTYQDDLSAELRNFLRNPESEKYIQYAYKRYQYDKLEEEKERLKKELEDI